MDDTTIDILNSAYKLFMRFGIKSVSMDDISREMGISKKTLYKYFDSKKDLVMAVTLKHNEEECLAMEHITKEANDAIEEMVLINKHVRQMMRQLQPTVIYDLKKYYRESWKVIEGIHTDFVYSIISKNIENGQKQGFYRKDIDTDMISRIYAGNSMLLMDEDLFPMARFKKEDLYNTYIDYHLNAIMTSDGKKLYQKYSQL